MYADGGRSFIGETQTGAFYPLNLLMGLFPRNAKGLLPVSLIEGFVILHAFLAAFFMYGLATHFGLNRFSAFVAGIAFAFGGSLGLRAFAQVNLFYASVWVPAVFWCYAESLRAHHLFRQILFANLAGLALALSLLAGHHQPFIYVSLALAGVALALWLRSRKSPDESPSPAPLILRQTLLLFAFALAYASLQLLPSLEYSKLAYRWVEQRQPYVGRSACALFDCGHGQFAASRWADSDVVSLPRRCGEQSLPGNSAPVAGPSLAAVG